LARPDEPPDDADMSQSPADVPDQNASSPWERLSQGEWCHLTDILSMRELEASAKAAPRSWTIQQDGTLVSDQAGYMRLTLPLKPTGSYAIRYVCRADRMGDINVNLPIGQHSTLFTLGGRCGIQMIGGKQLSDPGSVGLLDPGRYRLQPHVPVRVEIHVDLLPVESQTVEQRKMTNGQDWARISVQINGAAAITVPAATASFSVFQAYAITPDHLGFSASTPCACGEIQLYRK
jgi:hypothetical protein